jgi:hypothetical protein
MSARAAAAVLALTLLAGCGPAEPRPDPMSQRIAELERQVEELEGQYVDRYGVSTDENAQTHPTTSDLYGGGASVLERITHLRIRIEDLKRIRDSREEGRT